MQSHLAVNQMDL